MRKYILLAVLLLLIPFGAYSMIMGSGGISSVSVPNLISETFENAFDFSWDTEGGDSFSGTTPGSRSSSSYSRLFENISGNDRCVETTGDQSAIYAHFWFYFTDPTQWTDEDYVIILQCNNSGANTVVNVKIDREDDVSSYRILGAYYDNGNQAFSVFNISSSTWYEIKIKYDTGGGADWCDIQFREDGGAWNVLANDDSLISARTPNILLLGADSEAITPTDADIYIDAFSLDSSQDFDLES